ncbi:MAG: serpin family protein [Tangfeifania sp.]
MKKLFSLFFTVLFFAGCNLTGDSPDNELNVTEKTARLIEAENEFGFELFKNIYTAETKSENINVNRPFMYAITEKGTGAILFMGTVKNPQED